MSSIVANSFLRGALAMASIIAGTFFLRFWRTSGDRLFIFFAIAFWALAASWAGLGLTQASDETAPYILTVRLVAFLIILAGIVDKNRRSS